jgi:hypothetical protein
MATHLVPQTKACPKFVQEFFLEENKSYFGAYLYKKKYVLIVQY